MSGGVDSSVAAYLAQREGYECIGCTMKLYTNTDAGISERHTCCSLDDVEDARAVAYRLGMRYCVFNFSEGFREQVMLPFCEAYRRARTPNPCIECNRRMKFDALFRRAEELGCEKIVTGHYARIARAGERYILQKALDETKDQSYVLYAMTQRELAHTLFPLGAMRKSETRAIAETQGFGNARKTDSQDICFAPDGDYAAAIGRLTGEKSVPGAFVSTDGRVLGEHKGIIHYTVGQRRGLGIPHGERLYVCRIDPERNEVVLGEEKDLYRSEAAVSDVNWISGETPREPVRCAVDERHGLFLGAVFNKFDREIRRKEKRQQLQTVDHGLAQNFQKQRDKPPEAEYQTVYHRTTEMFHRNCEFLFVFCGCFSPQNGV